MASPLAAVNLKIFDESVEQRKMTLKKTKKEILKNILWIFVIFPELTLMTVVGLMVAIKFHEQIWIKITQ